MSERAFSLMHVCPFGPLFLCSVCPFVDRERAFAQCVLLWTERERLLSVSFCGQRESICSVCPFVDRERAFAQCVLLWTERERFVLLFTCCQIVGDGQQRALTSTTQGSDKCILSFHQRSEAVRRLIISDTSCVPVHMSSPCLVISERENDVD